MRHLFLCLSICLLVSLSIPTNNSRASVYSRRSLALPPLRNLSKMASIACGYFLELVASNATVRPWPGCPVAASVGNPRQGSPVGELGTFPTLECSPLFPRVEIFYCCVAGRELRDSFTHASPVAWLRQMQLWYHSRETVFEETEFAVKKKPKQLVT